MENYTNGDLTLEFIEDGNKLIIKWVGKSNDCSPSDYLLPLFEEIIKNFTHNELLIDFTNLQSLNSSTVPPIVKLVKNLEGNQIQSVILCNPGVDWQKNTFKALETVIINFAYVRINYI